MAESEAVILAKDPEGYPVGIFPDGKVDEKFLCNFCRKVLREPVQSFCGHRFCKSCIDKNIKLGQPIQCVKCRSEEVEDDDDYSMLQPDQIFPDKAVYREMAKLKVKCSYPECSWSGTFKEYEEHVKDCEFRPVPCPNCSAEVPASTMLEHLEKHCLQRPMTCKHCKMEIKFAELEIINLCQECGKTFKHHRSLKRHENTHKGRMPYHCCDKTFADHTRFVRHSLYARTCKEHNGVCLKYPLKCEACGKKKILREKMAYHIEKECTSQKVQCPLGCGWFDKSSFLDHLMSNVPMHLYWIVQEMSNLQKYIKSLEEKLFQETGLLNNKVDEQMVILHTRIQALETRPVESVTELSGQPELDQRIRQAVDVRVQGMNENIKTVEVKAGTFEGIANSLHRELDKTITALENLERHRRSMKDELEENKQKTRSLERTIALKDIAIAELDLRVQSLESASYDGSFIWKVTEYSKKQQEASQGRSISIYSPAFYTSHHGYKACARLYPNGDGMGKGTHISLFFVVMRGQYDALQQWPFKQRVTFCLVNQNGGEHILDSFRPDPASSSFKRPSSDMNIASGCPLFIRLETLQAVSSGFLRDDTLYIKIAVDVSDLRDPLSHPEDKIKVVPVDTQRGRDA